MATFDDDRERQLDALHKRMIAARGFSGDPAVHWSAEFENYDALGYYPLATPLLARPIVALPQHMPGHLIPASPPVASTADILVVDCVEMYRRTDRGTTRPTYLLIHTTGLGGPGPDNQYGPRLAPVLGAYSGYVAYEPTFLREPGAVPITPLDAGEPVFDPFTGMLTYSSDPGFDVGASTIKITCWVYRGPTLLDVIGGLGGGGGGTPLSRCDRVATAAQTPGVASGAIALLINAVPVTLDLASVGASLVFCNGMKLLHGVDYRLQANAVSGHGELVLLNDSVESGRYVAQDCDEIEAHVVRT